MEYKRSALVLSLLLCLAPDAGALIIYTENTEAQFTAGSHNSTYITGADPNVNINLDYYGRAAGLSAPGSDEWFNSGWKYRQPLSLNSSNPATLSDYPVAVTLNTQDAVTAGRMNSDGSDIRFTTAAAAGSAASLSYYIESGINTAATKIWVKLPSVAAGAATIYLYSGSTSAAAVSSMANTFVMGDNFNASNGAAPSTATWANIESAPPASGSLRDIQSNRLRLYFGSPLNLRHYGLRSANQYSFAAGRHYRAEINARTSGSDSWSSVTLCQAIYTYSYDQDDWLRFSIKHSAAGATYTLERSDYGTKTTLSSGTASAGFHGVDFLVSASSFSVLLDGSQIYSGANNLAFNSPYIYLEASSASSSLDEFLFDNVFVQPYSSPEPAYGSPGAGQGRRYPSGSFTSQVKDSSSTGTNYQNINWAAVTPSSASLTFEIRAHDTNILLSTFTAAAAGGNPAVSGRYVQYRLNLATLDPRYTSTVSSVTLTYGSPPLAPSGAAGTALSETSINWSWTDNSSGQYQEDGFSVLDATGALKGSVASGTTWWIEPSLNPNTQYSRQIIGYNAAGNGPPSAVLKYTLPAAPNVSCDKSTGVWISGSLTCINMAGFGNNGVAYYRYAWTQIPTYAAWSGSEAQWVSGSLLYSPPTGEYYLHLKSYNGENVPATGYQTYGPYWYDKNAPAITGFSPSSSPWISTFVNPVVSLSDTGGSKLYRVRNRWTTSSDRPAVGWQAWDYAISGADTASPNFTQAGAGQWYLHIEAEDIAGNLSYSYSGVYKIDLTNPTGSIVINGGDANTPRKEVTLSLTYADSESGVKNLAYKNLGDGWSAAELPQAATAWVLAAGDGSKQVYLQVTDNAGRTQQYADTIILNSQTSLLGAAVSGAASGVMGEPAETFDARAVLSWAPTGALLSGKTLSFYFNGSTRTALTDSLGAATTGFNVPTASGTYVYSVSFSADGIYSASSSTGTLAAAQRSSSLITEDVNATSGADFIAKATLKDFNTEVLIIGSTVTFIFEGSTKTAVTNGIGVATVTFTAPGPIGFYDYSASYAGGPVYAPKSAVSRVGVGLRVTNLLVPGLTALGQAGFNAQATLMDGTMTVVGSTITFVFQGSTRTAVTNASGVALSSFTAPASSGTYAYTAAFPGNATYTPSSGGATLTVNRRPLSLAGDILQGYVNAAFQARATLSDGVTAQKVAGKSIVFVFESSSAAVLTDANGVSTAVFNSDSLPRASTCYYYFSGDSGYAFADSTGAVSIDRRPVALAASDAPALLNSSFTAIASLKDTAFTPTAIPGKTITFSFLGSTKTAVTDAVGVASVAYQTGLSTGSYEFYASFDQDGTYLAGNDTGTVTLDKRPSAVTAYPSYTSAFNSIKLVADLKDSITGGYISSQTVIFNYNGVPQSTTTGASSAISGRANAVYPSTGVAGTYSFYADFPGNSLYSANGSTASITVSQRSVSLTAFPQTAIWSTTFTVTAEFRDVATNTPVNGKTIRIVFSTAATNAVTSGAGVAASTFSAPSSTGAFNWLAEFAGDQAYAAISSTGTVTVNPRAPVLTAIAASKYVWDNVFLSATFFDDTLPIDSKQLSFYFMGSTLTATTNGSGLATAGPFASVSTPGVYGYSAQFAGDAGYSAQSGSSTLSVSARISNISLGPVSVIASSTFTLSATLIDTNWASVITGKTVSFTLQGATYAVSAVTDGSGIARAVYTSSSVTGAYTYSATFGGNTNYAGASSSDTVTVTVRPSVLEMADYYPPAGSTFTASAVLKDFTTGVTISTKTVSFLFLGSTRTAVTDALGSASTTYVTLSSTMSYPISASFAGDSLYSPASINKTVFPGRRNTALLTSDMLSAVAKDTFSVTARLSDYDLGSYIAGSTITFSFSGSTYTLNAITNSSGTAGVNFTAPSSTGSYTYDAAFAGTPLYNGANNTSSVLVNRRNITIEPADLTSIPATSTFTASALLKDGAITLSTRTLTFVFYSTRTAVTNAVGLASTTFAAPLSTGTFTYAVSYAGDALYNPGSANGSVGVVLRPSKVELGPVSVIAGSTFTLATTLTDTDLDTPITGKSVSFTLQGATYTLSAITNSSGIAGVVYISSSVTGIYTYSATFGGDTTYAGAYSSNTVTVTLRPSVLEMADYYPPAGSTFTVSAVLKDFTTGLALSTKTVSFLFMSSTKTAVTDALGSASTTYVTLSSTISYPISASFAGDSLYSPTALNKTVYPGRRNTALQTSDMLSAVAKDTFTVTARLSDYDLGSYIAGSTITFSFSGSTYTLNAVTNSTGAAGVNFTAPSSTGSYTYNAAFAGTPLYNGITSTSSVLVNRRNITIEPADLTSIPATSTFTASALLKDGAITLSSRTLTFVLVSTKTAVTNGIGVASTTFAAPLSTGTFTYAVSYAGDALYNPGSANGSVGVILKPTVLEVLDAPDAVVGLPFDCEARLKDIELGNALVLSTKTITFVFSTNTVNAFTSVGVATAAFNAPVTTGTYVYTATFAGDSVYGASQSTGTVTVKRRPVLFALTTIPSEVTTITSFTVKGVLYDGKMAGVALSSRSISFVFQNTTKTVVTDELGVASATFFSPLSFGNYSYYGYFYGDASYNESTPQDSSKIVTVVTRDVVIYPTDINSGQLTWRYALDAFTPGVKVVDKDLAPAGVGGLTVSFVFQGSTITGTSASDGVAWSGSAFPGLPTKNTYYPCAAAFAGDQTYSPAYLPGSATCSGNCAAIGRIWNNERWAYLPTSDVVTYPAQSQEISASLVDWSNAAHNNALVGKLVRFRVSSVPYPAAPVYSTEYWGTVNAANVATTTVTTPPDAGDYQIEAWWGGDQTYGGASMLTTNYLKVGKRLTAIMRTDGDPIKVGAAMPIDIRATLLAQYATLNPVDSKEMDIVFATTQTLITGTGGAMGTVKATFGGLAVGTYTYIARFPKNSLYPNGDPTFMAAESTGTVIVEKNDTNLVADQALLVPAQNNFTARATLTVKIGAVWVAYAGKTIDFVFTSTGGPVNLSMATDVNGVAAVVYGAPMTVGDYNYTATLPENATDKTSFDNVNLVQVVKRNTSMLAENGSVYILDNFTSTATLKDTDMTPATGLGGKTVSFILHGPETTRAAVTAGAGALGQATTVFFSPAAAGSYEYSASFNGDAVYKVSSDTKTITVSKRVTLTSASDLTTPTNSIFTTSATLTDITPTLGGVLTPLPGLQVKFVFDGVTKYGITDGNGIAYSTFTAPASAGSPTFTATYEGNTTYAASNITRIVTVTLRPTTVSGTNVPSAPAGASFTALATLTDVLSGDKLSGFPVEFVFTGTDTFNGASDTDINGDASFIFTAPVSTGNYNYTARYLGNTAYAASSDLVNSVVVNMASTTLSTVNGSVVVNDAGQTADVYQASATLKGTISGAAVTGKNIEFVYNGVSLGYALTNQSGIATKPITPLSTGSVRLDVIFTEDLAFYGSASSGTITVSRRDTSMGVNPVSIPVNGVFYATATLTDIHAAPNLKVNGRQINFLLDGVDPKSAYTNTLGIATVTYTAMGAPGNMTITAAFTNDPIYADSSNTGNVSVSKRNTSVALTTATPLALDVFGATATLKNDLGETLSGKPINFLYKGLTPQTVATDINGQAFVQYNAGVSSGPWRLDATFDGSLDTQYITSTASGAITVSRRDCRVWPANVTVPILTGFTAGATMYDILTSSTPSGKTVSFGFSWNPSTFTSVTDSSGVANLAFTAPATSGTYRIETFYLGDATYNPSAASTATVIVTQRPTQLSLADAATMIGRVFTATATLKNDTTLLGDKDILFTFEGKPFNVKTGVGGSLGIAVATFTVTVSTGANQIDAVFNGDSAYFNSNAATATVTAAMRPTALTSIAATVVADKVFIATATLKDIDNLTLPGQPVSFIFNGNTLWPNTNTIGVATAPFTASVATGVYNVPVDFAGDYKYVASSTTLSVTVTRRSTSLTPAGNVTALALDVFSDTVTLKDLDNLTLPSQSLRFVFSGSTFTKLTDGSGIASSTFSAPASSGTHYVNIYFDGDAKYLPSSTAITLTDQQRPTAIALNNLSATALDLFKTTATLTDQNNAAIKVSTKTVTFSFSWGASTSAVTDGVGVATASYNATAAASPSYTLTGAFAGDATFASTTTVIAFPVAKRNAFVNGVYVSTRVFDVFTATGTFYDSVSSAPVSGRPMKFSLQNVSTQTAATDLAGVYSVNFTAPAASGTYTISIWSDGDATYNPTSVYISSVTLARRASSITLSGPAASIINSSFTAGGVLVDPLGGGNVQSKLISFLFQGATVAATTGVSGATSTVYTANLSSGAYQLQASFAGDASYNPSVSTQSIVTLRYPTLLAAPAITVTMNEVLTATATLTDYKASTVPAKALVFYFQGSSFTAVTDGLGVAYSTYSAAIASGTYQLPVSFAGDSLYDPVNASIPVLVNKRMALLTPDPVTITALDIFTATATLADARVPAQKLTGQTVVFNFLVGGSTFTGSGVTDVNGMAVSTFTAPVSTGAYQIRSDFAGNATYYPLSVYSAVTVTLRPTKLMQDNSAAAIDEVFRTTATLVDLATLQPVLSRTIDFTFGSSSSAVTVAGGKASVNFTAPSSSGPFQLDSSFAGDATYATASSTGALTVSRRPAVMAAMDIAGMIDEVFTATVTVSDGLNSVKVATRAIAFVFGSTFTSVTNVNGVALSTFLAPSSSGTYYAAINFAGDSRYLPAGTTTQLSVDRRPSGIIPENLTTWAAQVFTATATLRDVINPAYKPSGRQLKFVFAGSTFTALTDADGVAVSTFMSPSSSGTVRMDISFAGDSRYQASSSSAAVTVQRRLFVITIAPALIQTLNVLTATATLTDKINPAVPTNGRQLTFTFTAADFISVTDAGGVAVSTFAGPVSSGTYMLEARVAGDAVYEDGYSSGPVVVIQRPARLMQDNSPAVIDEIFRTTATLVDLATSQIISSRTVTFTFGSSSSAVTGAGGKASVNFTAPSSSGPFQLDSSFAGDATYATVSSTAVLTVSRRPAVMAAPGVSGIIDEVFTATVTVSDGLNSIKVATRAIAFVFGSTFTSVTNVNGVAVSTFMAPSSSGTYYADINFAGDSRYLPIGTTTQLSVDRRPSLISPDGITTRVGQVFTATATLRDILNPASKPAGRPLIFLFAGSSFTASTDVNGIAVSTFMSPSSSGTVRLDISFGGDSRYQASSSSAAVTVLQRLSAIAIEPGLIRALEVLTATATLTDVMNPGIFADGRVLTFSFSGADFASVTDAGGIAVSTFAGPVSSGAYLVEASFAGDAVYETAYSSGSVVVIQRPSGITITDGSAYPYETFTATGSIRDSATAAPVAGRYLLFDLNATTAGAITSGLGVATAAYTPPGAFGNYQLSADFAGDGTYAAAASTGTVSVMRRPTAIAALDSATIALNVFTASATLSDIRFSSAVAGKNVVFVFEGQSSTGTTNAYGVAVASFAAPVSSGAYYYQASFTGDSVYAVSAATGAIAVGTRFTRVIANNTNANVGEPFTLSAKLVDPAKEDLPGYSVANVDMEFRFKDRDGVVLDTKIGRTNELGIATAAFSGPGSPDVYYYTAKFYGDYTYSASSATAMIKVGLLTSLVAFDVDTIALEKFTGKVKLTDYLSTTLDDKLVRFKFLSANNSGMTNAAGDSGVASSTFSAPSSSGTYFYTAYFDGDAVYSASNATATVTVKLRPSAIVPSPAATFAYSSFTATVMLTNILPPYAAIGGRDINIVFNGSTLTANTNSGGMASAVFFASVSSGTYNFYVSFAGDDTYDASSNTGTVTVQLRPTTMLSYNVTNLTANSTFTARVQIKDSGNQPIPGLSVDFNFGPYFDIGATDALGMAETVFTAPASSGVYTYSAVFYGDLRYSSSSAPGDVTVGPRPTLVFTSAVSSKLGAPLNLSARLVDVSNQAGIAGQTLSFYYDGSTLTAPTDSFGASSVTFAAPLSTGTYYYEAAFAGGGVTYMGSSSSSTVTIALNLTNLEATEGISLKIYEPLQVAATLRDSIGLQMPGLPVTFTFGGLTSADVTDEFGRATTTFATTGLASTGTYNYTADYAGDTLYVASSDTSNVVNVYRRDSLLIARDATTVPNKAFTAEARFYDNVNGSAFMGAALSGKTVIFELYNSTFTATLTAATSALGVSTVSFISPVSTGTFLLTARFADGDPVYINALSSAALTVLLDDGTGAIKTKLRVESVNAYITKAFIASGTLTATDVPVTGKAVLFEFFNGIATYTAAGFTDNIGLATAPFTAPASSGTYYIMASFAGDPDFTAATGTATLTANRYPDSLTAQAVVAYAGEVFPAKAVLRDDLTMAFVAGRTVIFEFFNGVSTVTRTAVTSSTGSAETTFTSPAVPGDYVYTARFAGDTVYVGSLDTAAILIASKGSSTFLRSYDVFIGTGEVFAASATLMTGAAYPVQGKAVAITFQGILRISTTNAQGIVFSTFTAPSSSGTFIYQANFIGDADYNAALTTAAVSVVMRKEVEQPPAIKAEVSSTTVTLTWTAVIVSSAQVKEYTIEESASLRGVMTSSVTVSSTTLGYTYPVDETKATYLKLKTRLTDDQESGTSRKTSRIIEIPSKYEDPERVPNYYFMSQEENKWAAWVKIPGKVMDKVSADPAFGIQVEKNDNPAFLAAYTIKASGNSGNLDKDLKASEKKGVKLTIAYPRSGTGPSASGDQMALYWYNGVEWIKLGGELDVLTGEVYTYSRTFGQFAIKAAPLSSVFNLTTVVPRIFSPDAPDPGNIINRATFVFENPGCGEVTIRIFDITGALVRRNLVAAGCTVMYWNGKDQGGAVVKGGVYIYQIEAGNKVVTGTVVVAK